MSAVTAPSHQRQWVREDQHQHPRKTCILIRSSNTVSGTCRSDAKPVAPCTHRLNSAHLSGRHRSLDSSWSLYFAKTERKTTKVYTVHSYNSHAHLYNGYLQRMNEYHSEKEAVHRQLFLAPCTSRTGVSEACKVAEKECFMSIAFKLYFSFTWSIHL